MQWGIGGTGHRDWYLISDRVPHSLRALHILTDVSFIALDGSCYFLCICISKVYFLALWYFGIHIMCFLDAQASLESIMSWRHWQKIIGSLTENNWVTDRKLFIFFRIPVIPVIPVSPVSPVRLAHLWVDFRVISFSFPGSSVNYKISYYFFLATR